MRRRWGAAVLEIGGHDGIELLLTEHRAHPNDLQYFRALALNRRSARCWC